MNIITGDALKVLSTLAENYVDMIITSPPYWQQRDYENNKQLGQEPTVSEYIENLVKVFTEAKRVLKNTGTLWVNIGDCYRNKELQQIPHRFAIAMAENWLLRNTIIWHKPNVSPESCKDRFTVDFEYLFFFTQQKHYFFNQQLEKAIWAEKDKRSKVKGGVRNKTGKSTLGKYSISGTCFTANGMKNKRAVWRINTS